MLMRKMGEVASLGIRTFEVEGKGYFGQYGGVIIILFGKMVIIVVSVINMRVLMFNYQFRLHE